MGKQGWLGQSKEDIAAAAARLRPNGRAVIGGRHVDAVSGKAYDNRSSRDGASLGPVAECGLEDVDMAVRSARAAFPRWAATAPTTRKKILLRLAELIEQNREELALLETLDTGKPIYESERVDLPIAIEKFLWYAEASDKIYGQTAPVGSRSMAMIQYAPLGVVACVVPWNFPLNMAAQKAIPALVAGNTVVLKPAEQTPLTALRMAELALEAGVPEGVFNVVTGYGDVVGKALGLHPDVDAIGFTGSTEVGKLFLQYSGQSNMKQVALECGGKSANIVFADCPDLDAAADMSAFGVFHNAGQICDAGSRLIIERSVKDAFLERLCERAGHRAPGDPLDPATRMGALLDKRQFDRVMGHIDGSVAEGASIHLGGKPADILPGGHYVEPTIIDGVTSRMRIGQEEVFGPVLSVLTFDTADEAVAIANDTVYGLSGGLWSRDITRALTVANQIEAGTIWVNAYDIGHMSVPFGGVKQSGFGKDRGIAAITKFTEQKVVWINLSEKGPGLEPGYV